MAPEASDAGSQARHNGVTISRLFSPVILVRRKIRSPVSTWAGREPKLVRHQT